ncbi:peptidase inhibitor family I36 protein [Paractinoplanes toevensis]|uniref:Peptidase inhibitor family I36 n=1 Tax=Paractinoplanes toevensis TaxID=571911 RepID=A0A919TII3_9ACTN|nr:peptidase inhibitor family I36 protein [Actinoplanes toevensis]GIM95005.1 hypothetical protein Ato02nite_067980 [Actinoplanes toevensis]
MNRTLRILAAAAAFTLAFGIGTPLAQAAPLEAARPTQLNQASAAVGEQWLQLLPSGELVTMEKVDQAVSRSVTEVRVAAASCPSLDYLCLWEGDLQDGTLWALKMNDIYSHTENGVAHCWNLASAYNNKTKSWYNSSDRMATIYNWVNCNGNENFKVYARQNSGHSAYCQGISPGNWCTTLFPTSVRASA